MATLMTAVELVIAFLAGLALRAGLIVALAAALVAVLVPVLYLVEGGRKLLGAAAGTARWS